VRPWVWLRVLSCVLALFSIGHTLGSIAPHAGRGAEESALFTSMQGFHFQIMGFERSHWDFYRGFAFFLSLALAVLAVLAWQVAAAAKRERRQALPMIIVLWVFCLAQLGLSCSFFFTAPIVTSALAVVAATMALLSALLPRRQRLAAA
jgi:hypothetical protein